MTPRDFDLRLSHLQGEKETCYGAMAILVILAPAVILKNGFKGWLGSLRLMRGNLKVVAAEEARLRAMTPQGR